MTKIVVLGVPGEEALWAADLDAGTVMQIGAATSGSLKAADDLRRAGVTVAHGVDLAALAPNGATLTNLSSGIYDT